MVKLGNISAPEVSAWGSGSSSGDWRTTPTGSKKSGKTFANDDYRAENESKQDSPQQNKEMSALNAQLEQAKTEEQQAQNRVDEYLFDNFAWLDTKDPAELEELNAQASAATQKREAIQTQVDALEYREKYSEKTYPDNFFGQTAASYTLGRMNQDSALAWNDYWKEPTQANRDKAQAIDETLYQFQRNNTQTLDDDATLPWISRSTASQIPQVLDSVKYGAVGALGGAVVGSAVPVVGTAAGAKAGYTAGSTKYAHDTMRGAAFRDLLAQGVDEETARSAAGSEALVNGAVEAADTLLDLATLGAGTAVKKGVGYAAGIGVGGAQEGVQTLVSTANLRRAQVGKTGVPGLVGDTVKLTWDALTGKDNETAQQAWTAAKEGMKVSTVLSGAANLASLPIMSKVNSYSAFSNTPTLSDGEISVMQQELTQMQNQKRLDELAAVYEANVPLTRTDTPSALQESAESGTITADRFTQSNTWTTESDLKPQSLMDELANSGVKYNPDDVVMTVKASDGTLLWLETGNEGAGLRHILDNHAGDLAAKGIYVDDIPRALNAVLTETPVLVEQDKRGMVAEFLINGKNFKVAYGTNGFIVSFYPVKKRKGH